MDERIEELEADYKEIYENPNVNYSFEKEYQGAKLVDLDDINFKTIPGFEKATEDEIKKLKEKLSKDSDFWVKKTDWK